MINRKRFVVSIVVAFLLPVTAFLLYFHIMVPSKKVIIVAGDRSAHFYYIDRDRLLLVWKDEVFFIHPESRWVGRPSDYRNSLLSKSFLSKSSSIVFWPRGSYESVLLGDGVKGDPREGFEFVADKIKIRSYFYTEDKMHELTTKI